MLNMTYAVSLASISANLTANADVVSTIQAAMEACSILECDAVGVLVRSPDTSRLDVLAASSHSVEILELTQALCGEGPCVEVLRWQSAVSAIAAAEILERWPDAGRVIVDAGYQSVHALPLRWHGSTFGGLNIFFRKSESLSAELLTMAQGIADLITMAIVHAGDSEASTNLRLALNLQIALELRNAVERAKGVIAQQDNVDVDVAFGRLVAVAAARDLSMSETAEHATRQAQTGAHWSDGL